MSRADKTLAAMRANPRADWRIAQLESVAKAFGVNIRKSGGSHVVFEHRASIEALSVPAKRRIKPIYVIRFVALMDSIRSSDETP